MATNPPSDASSIFADVGPVPDFELMYRLAGGLHPMSFRSDEDLVWYDGPCVSVGHVPGDPRPRLDILVHDTHEGPEGERVFTHRRHQLVYGDIASLVAGLHDKCIPTLESYGGALEAYEYRTVSTQIGHPRPSHSATARRIDLETADRGDLPDGKFPPDGMRTAWGRAEPPDWRGQGPS